MKELSDVAREIVRLVERINEMTERRLDGERPSRAELVEYQRLKLRLLAGIARPGLDRPAFQRDGAGQVKILDTELPFDTMLTMSTERLHLVPASPIGLNMMYPKPIVPGYGIHFGGHRRQAGTSWSGYDVQPCRA